MNSINVSGGIKSQGSTKELHSSLSFTEVWEQTWPVIALNKCSMPTSNTGCWVFKPKKGTLKYGLWQAEKILEAYSKDENDGGKIEEFGWWEVDTFNQEQKKARFGPSRIDILTHDLDKDHNDQTKFQISIEEARVGLNLTKEGAEKLDGNGSGFVSKEELIKNEYKLGEEYRTRKDSSVDIGSTTATTANHAIKRIPLTTPLEGVHVVGASSRKRATTDVISIRIPLKGAHVAVNSAYNDC